MCAIGVKGEWNHTPREYAVVESIFERAKLLIACVRTQSKRRPYVEYNTIGMERSKVSQKEKKCRIQDKLERDG
jgi:hypothetical protein